MRNKGSEKEAFSFHPLKRGDGRCKSLRNGKGGAFEPRGGNAAPVPPLQGNEVPRIQKQKQDNGADFIISQLCWDMDAFRYWLDAIRGAGIWLPVDVGIMPILDQAATINMALSRNGCVMDRKLCEIISKNWIFPNPFEKEPFDADVEGKKASFKAAGIEYTINQIDEYRACGVDGIHLYALNKYDDVANIAKMAGLIDLV